MASQTPRRQSHVAGVLAARKTIPGTLNSEVEYSVRLSNFLSKTNIIFNAI